MLADFINVFDFIGVFSHETHSRSVAGPDGIILFYQVAKIIRNIGGMRQAVVVGVVTGFDAVQFFDEVVYFFSVPTAENIVPIRREYTVFQAGVDFYLFQGKAR